MQTPCPHPECATPAFAVTSVKVPSRLFWNRCEVGSAPGGKPPNPRAVHQKNVEPAVVVVIVESHAAACGFEQILVFLLGSENSFHVQARLASYVEKADAGIRGLRTGIPWRVSFLIR